MGHVMRTRLKLGLAQRPAALHLPLYSRTTMDLQELNKQFGVAENITFVAGKNGLTRVDLTLDGASASVYLLGATVTSFQDSPGKDIIWLRYAHLYSTHAY